MLCSKNKEKIFQNRSWIYKSEIAAEKKKNEIQRINAVHFLKKNISPPYGMHRNNWSTRAEIIQVNE